ncbi:leucine Rich Repeat [Seminavis robusta]|uniref:Leucine Rich Repeat n=1 Tax=Seminavis robusta TaxID=568900 RepID=A0A9N8DGS3_9STRA|nr:leucine Rich Repeat [Seminavis robusta]|eukprot:Sro118_g057780.1 leucine Rich Repeat (1494) ;mRNA; r:71728-76627
MEDGHSDDDDEELGRKKRLLDQEKQSNVASKRRKTDTMAAGNEVDLTHCDSDSDTDDPDTSSHPVTGGQAPRENEAEDDAKGREGSTEPTLAQETSNMADNVHETTTGGDGSKSKEIGQLAVTMADIFEELAQEESANRTAKPGEENASEWPDEEESHGDNREAVETATNKTSGEVVAETNGDEVEATMTVVEHAENDNDETPDSDESSAEEDDLLASHDQGHSNNSNLQEETIQLEEEIRLLEQSIKSLNARKHGMDRQMEASTARQLKIAKALAFQRERKQHLLASQSKHQTLLQDLQKSLTKSQDILMRLNTTSTSSNDDDDDEEAVVVLTEEEIQKLTEEIRRQEERTTQQQQQLQQDDEGQEEEESPHINTNPLPLSSTNEKKVVPSCPIIPIHEDASRLEAFWKGHNIMYDSHSCLHSFIPCIGSQETLVRIMDIIAEETLAQDANNDTTQAAEYRRNSLRNTCLDFVLMAGNTQHVKKASNQNNIPIAEQAKTDVATTGRDDEQPNQESALHLNPHVALCPYELAGVCADPYCPYQHINVENRPNKVSLLPREMLPLPPLKLPEQQNTDEEKLEEASDKQRSILVEAKEEQGVTEATAQVDQLAATRQLASSNDDDDTRELSHDESKMVQAPAAAHLEGEHTHEQSAEARSEENDVACNEFDANMDFIPFGDGSVEERRAETRSEPQENEDDVACNEFDANMDFIPFGDGSAEERGAETKMEERGAETKSDSQENDNEHVVASNEFDANMDFIPFGDGSVEERGESDADDESDGVVDLETAGLLRLTTGRTSGANEELQTSIEKIPSWPWWRSEENGMSQNTPQELSSFDDFLLSYGEFQAHRNKDGPRVLEYHGTIPTSSSAQQVFAFTARVVDCAGLMVHAGRFDLTEPLCTIAANVMRSASRENSTVEGKTTAVFHQVLETLLPTLKTAYSCQHGIRGTFRCQLLLALISDRLKRCHHALAISTEDEPWSLHWGSDWSNQLSGMLSESGENDLEQGYPNHGRKLDAWYIRESVKEAVFRKDDAEGVSDDKHEMRLSLALLSNLREALVFSSAVRARFSLDAAANDYVKSIWTIVKSRLCQRTRVLPRSAVFQRSYIYFGYILLGVLEGAVDYLNGLEGGNIHALAFSSLVQLDVAIYGIIKQLTNNPRSADDESPILELLFTPILAASASLSCRLGQYAKAQHRLEDALSISTTKSKLPNFMTYSELLWSQLLHLRSSLPFSQQAMTTNKPARRSGTLLPKDLKQQHEALAITVAMLGLDLHHVCLAGDWNLLARMKLPGSARATKSNGSKEATKLSSLSTSLLRDGTEDLSIVLQSGSSIQSLSRSELSTRFPMSLLVYGNKITSLSLVSCELLDLPFSFGVYLSNLKALDVSRNNLVFLPDSFGALKNLRSFAANDNKLQALPSSFGRLSMLRKLLLCNNAFTSFPLSLRRLKQLEELQLAGSEFTMSNSAQLTLELPKLRFFSAPVVTGDRDEEVQREES